MQVPANTRPSLWGGVGGAVLLCDRRLHLGRLSDWWQCPPAAGWLGPRRCRRVTGADLRRTVPPPRPTARRRLRRLPSRVHGSAARSSKRAGLHSCPAARRPIPTWRAPVERCWRLRRFPKADAAPDGPTHLTIAGALVSSTFTKVTDASPCLSIGSSPSNME